jgi:hypothetical protein
VSRAPLIKTVDAEITLSEPDGVALYNKLERNNRRQGVDHHGRR